MSIHIINKYLEKMTILSANVYPRPGTSKKLSTSTSKETATVGSTFCAVAESLACHRGRVRPNSFGEICLVLSELNALQ